MFGARVGLPACINDRLFVERKVDRKIEKEKWSAKAATF